MKPHLRIVFFGTSSFAVPVLGSLLGSVHPVLCVVTRPPMPAGRGRSLTQPPVYLHIRENAPRVDVHQPAKLTEEFIGILAEMEPDVMVTASYGAWLPEGLLGIPRLGVLNVHPSLLPLYRGASPVIRAILDGREETGVSFMLTDSGWDTGPVVAVYRESIHPDDTAGTLEDRLARLAGDMILPTLEGYDGGSLEPEPQKGEPLYAKKISAGETWLDWKCTARSLERKVRAFQPSPGARTSHGGRLLKVIAACVSNASVPPGEVAVEGGSLTVGCGDGESLRIISLQPASRGVMTAEEFLRGYRMRTGDRLERP